MPPNDIMFMHFTKKFLLLQNMRRSRRGLVVGNYCHDILLKNDIVLSKSLGGAISFISNILPKLSVNSVNYISKVGSDFKYSVNYPPIVDPTSKTILFHAHFNDKLGPGPDRVLKRVNACNPIRPEDLPAANAKRKYSFGLAAGVGGEILPETLDKMTDICDVVFVDIQELIREFDENDGTVRLVNLKDTKYNELMSKIGVLKASAEEAEYIDVEEVRKVCCVVVTYGEDGCKVFWKDGEVKIPPFKAVQVDPTGAGDTSLGGFVAGLVNGLAVPDAALLGNFFGSLSVEQIGLPKFDPKLLQRVRVEVHKRALQCAKHRVDDANELLWFSKPPGHDEFHASLNYVRQSPQKLECGLPRLGNLCINHLCKGDKVLQEPLYDEPIQVVEGSP